MPEYPILLTLQQAAKRSGKSEKTLRRWISSGKLIAHKVGDKSADPYLIDPKDLDVAGGVKTAEWKVEQEVADLRLRVGILEATLEEMHDQLRDQARTIEELRRKLPAPAVKKKATTTRPRKTSTRRKPQDELW
jgi:excisionase family DNA binding protein